MDRVSVPFVEIKKELLNDPEFKEEYDKLKQEYQVTDELQALTMELQTLSDSGRHKKEFEQKLKRWHELKRQKIITMLQPILLSIYGDNIAEIISFTADDLGYVNLALLLDNCTVDTDDNRQVMQEKIEQIEMQENLCGDSIMYWEIDWESYRKKNCSLYDEVRSGQIVYSRR